VELARDEGQCGEQLGEQRGPAGARVDGSPGHRSSLPRTAASPILEAMIVIIGIAGAATVLVAVAVVRVRRARQRREQLSWVGPPQVAPRPTADDLARRQDASSDSPFPPPLD